MFLDHYDIARDAENSVNSGTRVSQLPVKVAASHFGRTKGVQGFLIPFALDS